MYYPWWQSKKTIGNVKRANITNIAFATNLQLNLGRVTFLGLGHIPLGQGVHTGSLKNVMAIIGFQ
jgi:hypothetical protein